MDLSITPGQKPETVKKNLAYSKTSHQSLNPFVQEQQVPISTANTYLN
jgi:hypothetical protein